MDPRAIGRWSMLSLQQTLPAVIAMDELEAGHCGTGVRSWKSKVDGLAFLGLSLGHNSEQGHPDSETHQKRLSI
jgi:hypothetical protein